MDYSENLTGTCYLESLKRQVLITVTKMADVTLHFQKQSQTFLAFSFKCFLNRYFKLSFYLASKINPTVFCKHICFLRLMKLGEY